jgi:transposase-like protein
MQGRGRVSESLRKRMRQAEVDAGSRSGTPSQDAAELARLRRENKELRRANEILKAASVFLARELCAHADVSISTNLEPRMGTVTRHAGAPTMPG